ncbi:hypothetical protein M413DRAFT_439079 [Hebeloma cylindrosporum]|uniref:Uncharacterized protein n=1 Tax=Hebeloma cylindrosporum TaxID=76867 RepID=A0A0C2YC11_HEBCY|nr:hypothetical protein M413DRAFT_439079 [Hebeloma cylindrosporum h7]
MNREDESTERCLSHRNPPSSPRFWVPSLTRVLALEYILQNLFFTSYFYPRARGVGFYL